MQVNKFIFIIYSAILPVLSNSSCSGQDNINFSGYFLEFPIYQHSRSTGRDLIANITRLRLRPTVFFSENSHLALEYEVALLYESSGFAVQQQGDRSARQVADLSWNPVYSNLWNIRHFIDRLYYRHDLSFLELTLGRQRIAWGTGRVWNPTDLFNPINPTQFAKVEKDGVDAILAKFTLGNFSDISLVYNPANNWHINNLGFRVRTNYHEFDLSTMGGIFDHRPVLGGDFAGNFFGAGIRGEGIISFDNSKFESSFIKYIVGIDYQFSSEFYSLIEYHHNGEGSKDKYKYDLLRLYEGNILNLGRNYFVLQGSYLIHPLLSATGGCNLNIDDYSFYVNLIISYSASDEIVVSLGGQTFVGEKLSEFWYYSSGIYIKGDIYFGN